MLDTHFIQLVPGAIYLEKHGVARRIHSSGTQFFSRFSLRETNLQREFLRFWSCCQSFRRCVERKRTCDANRRRFAHRKSALFKPMARKKQTNRANLSRHGCLSHAIGTGWQSAATWRNRIPRHNTNIDLLFLLKLVKRLNQSPNIPSRYWKVIINDVSSVTSKFATPVGIHPIKSITRIGLVRSVKTSRRASLLVLEAITEIPFPRKENLCTRNESRDRP